MGFIKIPTSTEYNIITVQHSLLSANYTFQNYGWCDRTKRVDQRMIIRIATQENERTRGLGAWYQVSLLVGCFGIRIAAAYLHSNGRVHYLEAWV